MESQIDMTELSDRLSPEELERRRSKAIELNQSSQIDFNLCSDAPEVDAVVDEIYWMYNMRYQPKRKQPKTVKPNIKVLVLNLLRAKHLREDWYVAYPRGNDGYPSKKSRYNLTGVSPKMVEIVDLLTEGHLLEGEVGKHYRPGESQKNRRSRVRATSDLQAMFDRAGLTPDMIYQCPMRETVILRQPKRVDGTKPLDDYEDTDETIRMRENLTKINTLLNESSIELRLTPAEWDLLNARLIASKDDHRRHEPLDTSRVGLHRAFNDSRWDHGGRFYGGWWQNVYSEYREKIFINGLPTVEVDYASLHPRILYARIGLEAPEDCYAIQGVDPKHRTLVKQAFLRMINAYTNRAACLSLRRDLPALIEEYPESIEDLCRGIAETHEPIAEFFNTGEGIRLQYLDSKVAERIMLHFVEQGVPVLPVHDSFIVPCVKQDELLAVMSMEFKREFGFPGVAEVKGELFSLESYYKRWVGRSDEIEGNAGYPPQAAYKMR
ncbi:hypothetical protein [Pseudodesulfovibrio methanolicus]|uniref:DNA-directed DNA polymerase family A palm domain-containing protein n=1 Tax=Pseudodesulfovibrio methanolicus TaxID=3126690 RepID=A0ABZ2IW40_9BACT